MGSPKILIIGGKSRLGMALEHEFARHYEVLTISRPDLDLLGSPREIHRVLDGLDFDLLLLPAGITDV
ncbi:MAG: hypothetical protein AB7V57_22375, partial [Verrucomicrobiales bacterium]